VIIREWREKISDRLRRSKPDPTGIMTFAPKHIYILPTYYGMIFSAVLFLMLIGSMNYISNLGYMLTFTLGGLGLVGMIHTWRNLVNLEMKVGKVPAVFMGQDASFELILTNVSPKDRFAIAVKSAQGAEITEDVPANSSVSVHLHFPTYRRGIEPLGRLTFYTLFPIGLLRSWSYADPGMSCLVYPKPASKGLPKEQMVWAEQEGGDQGEGSDDFVGLRSYRLGDSPKHIDWKAFARERGLMCKQFGGNQAERLVLDWSLLKGYDTEYRLSLLCRFILIADEKNQYYSLLIPGVSITEDRGEQHKHRCLAALAMFQQGDFT